jgi:hypothetical protein
VIVVLPRGTDFVVYPLLRLRVDKLLEYCDLGDLGVLKIRPSLVEISYRNCVRLFNSSILSNETTSGYLDVFILDPPHRGLH